MSLQTDPIERAPAGVEAAEEPVELPDALELDRAPSPLTRLAAVGLAALAPLGFRGLGLVLGLLGVFLLAVDVFRGRRRLIHAGFMLLLAGVSVAAIQDAPLDAVLLGTVLAIVAWEVARYGITVGNQLGRAAETTRIEVAHTVWSVAVGLVAVLLLVGVSALVHARSTIGMWSLLVGVLILVVGLLFDR